MDLSQHSNTCPTALQYTGITKIRGDRDNWPGWQGEGTNYALAASTSGGRKTELIRDCWWPAGDREVSAGYRREEKQQQHCLLAEE